MGGGLFVRLLVQLWRGLFPDAAARYDAAEERFTNSRPGQRIITVLLWLVGAWVVVVVGGFSIGVRLTSR